MLWGWPPPEHPFPPPGGKTKGNIAQGATYKCEGLRFWKYDEVEDLINARLADLHDVEEMIRLSHKSKAEGKNFLNTEFREWELDYRIDRIIATEDLLRERVRTAEERYAQLHDIYENEKALRTME